uniref:Putative ixostatin n=1 Tax=Ixodes ricinus TaxID=34613 RepID=A0A0K8RD17_IXORI
MISTRILLLLAALAQACIAEKGCPKVSEDSFRGLNPPATKRRLHHLLGEFCQDRFYKNESVRCIGHLGPPSRNCPLCCACIGGAGIVYINATAPKSFPCGKHGNGKNPRTL